MKDQQARVERGTKYWAFISYSSKDSAWGNWLRRRLENYRIPKDLQGHRLSDGTMLGKFIRPIFRDRDELHSSANLGEEIGKALDDSRYLIVLCSPYSAQSRWVNKEITEFQAKGRGDRIFALILAGEPNSSDPNSECFPPALRQPEEPIAGDLRKQGDGRDRGFLKLLAGIAELDFDSLYRRHERAARRRRASILTAAILLTATFALLAIVAMLQRNEAVLQAVRARAQLLAVLSQGELQATIAQEQFGTDGSQRAALLALESLKLQPTVQGDLALRKAVARLPGRPNRFKIEDAEIVGLSFDGSRYLSCEYSSEVCFAYAVTDCGETGCVGPPEEISLLLDQEVLSPDWTRSAVVKEGGLELWRRSPQEMIWSVAMHHKIEEVVFLEGPGRIAARTKDEVIELDTRKRSKKSYKLSRKIRHVTSFQPEAGLVAFISEADEAVIMDYLHGSPVLSIAGSERWISAISANGRFAVLTPTRAGERYEIIDIPSGARVATLEHDWFPQLVQFSKDSQYLLTVTGQVSLDAADNSATTIPGSTVRVWSLDNFSELVKIRLGKEGGVKNPSLSGDGNWLLSPNANRSEAWLWNIYPINLRKEACVRLRRNLSSSEALEFLGTEVAPETCSGLPFPNDDGSYEQGDR